MGAVVSLVMLPIMVALALVMLLPEQVEQAPDHIRQCVQHPLPDRGLPGCEGAES